MLRYLCGGGSWHKVFFSHRSETTSGGLGQYLALAAGSFVVTTVVKAEEKASTPKTQVRAKMGGVKQEYKEQPRSITRLQPPLHGFFDKEIRAVGLPIRASECVSDAALVVAADRLSRMLRLMPEQVHARLARRGASFHIIGVDQGTSDLPEHRHMRGVPGGYTKEGDVTLDQRARGMGGVQSSCGEENLVDLDTDPRYRGRDILTHEFAHCIMDVGLAPKLRAEIESTYHRSVEQQNLWTQPDGRRVYAGSNASEYFAELTMWYFGTHGDFVDTVHKLPTPGPGGLASYDKEGFELLTSIYGGTHLGLGEEDPKTIRLQPVGGGTCSKDLEAEEVGMELDNRGCQCSWKLFWVTPQGERIQYGEVPKGACALQRTFPGHAWELVMDEGSTAACAQKRSLRYVAAEGPGMAVVGQDAGCLDVHAALITKAGAAVNSGAQVGVTAQPELTAADVIVAAEKVVADALGAASAVAAASA